MGNLKNKIDIFKKAHRKIAILLDSIKSIIIFFLLIFLIIFFMSSIVHNIIRVVEASNEYSGKYKNTFNAGDGMINVYSMGERRKNFNNIANYWRL